MSMLRILIADDHSLFRRGVKDLLIDGLGAVTIGECANAHELLDTIRHKEWDVVILDIGMPGTTGAEALKQLKAECPKLPVVVLSMHPEDQYAVRMLKAGASAYLTKASAPDELIHAIKTVVAGGHHISPSLGEQLVLGIKRGNEKPPHELLSDREYEVLCMIGSGKTVGEIAEAMFLSVTTISTYRARILEKMGMKTNAEMTRYALQHGLVE